MTEEANQEPDDRFPWPDEVEIPDDCAGWEEMYPRYFRFGQGADRSELERDRFWFWDQKDSPKPLRPWDITLCVESITMQLSQAQSRVFAVPPAMGIDLRIIAGYSYASPVPCTDPELLEERKAVFSERSEYVYENFEELYEDEWLPAVKDIGQEIRDLDVPEQLPEYAPEDVVYDAQGLYPGAVDIQSEYNRLQELTLRGWQRHFEYLNLVYLAYLSFKETCDDLFPDISDDAIGKMVTGLETDLFLADAVLNDLARQAMELGGDVPEILTSAGTPDEKMARLEETAAGRGFLEAFEDVKDPWFHITVSRGYHSADGSWLDTLEQPFDHLEEKVTALQEGTDIGRDIEALQDEREEIVAEYRSYLNESERARFDQAHELVLTVYNHAEDHQFWIENWLHTIIFQKLDEFGQLLVNHGFLEEPRDITLFGRTEVPELLADLARVWSQGHGAQTPAYWKEDAADRKRILEAAEEWSPPPAIGEPPEEVTDPMVIMLWGITTETVQNWLGTAGDEDGSEMNGFASSSGTVEGPARVITSGSELTAVERDEILVAPLTNPDWTPVLSKIAGAVTDNGGATSHTAIVCREYGVPAVTGVGTATTQLETGDRIRVNGTEGTVEVLEKAEQH
ncbi:pyruvate, water dikinase [Halopenitus malekzadehii]|uniref:Pyruvate, water dikinase n=1 Tax=Halopenitus malekzadehii TaxID=1267564 RepID=A0A1H6K4M2_9EURY|nr:PEP-utilizing enzyme [Halopenitus malekzadehii]SEH67882.1 pyruvate, water dikinase [Halopenitus malekzadehii]